MTASTTSRLIEARLLSVLKASEGIRFVFERAPAPRKIVVSIEGFGPNAEDLQYRVGGILSSARTKGFEFRSESTNAGITRASQPKSALNWIEIVPTTRDLMKLERNPLGFAAPTQDKVHCTTEKVLSVPNLSASALVRLNDQPAGVLLAHSSLRRMEIQFERIVLGEGEIKRVGESLGELLALQRFIPGLEMGTTPMAAFLALWWNARSGWELRCRVLCDRSEPIPSGVIEMLGRDIFNCECSIGGSGSNNMDRRAATLAQAYPDGWSFASMLPDDNEVDILSASMLHNRHIPDLPGTGILIGTADGHDVRLPEWSRDRHLYVVGGTGTGKTTLLKRLIREDLKRNEGLVLLDPHGDLFHETLEIIPRRRRRDLAVIDPGSDDGLIGFNVLDIPKDGLLKRRAEFLVGEFIRFFRGTWDNPEAFGPVFDLYFRNALRLLIHQEETRTLLEFEQIFVDRDFRRGLTGSCSDEGVKRFWLEIADKATGDISLANVTPYITSKTSVLSQSGFLSGMIGKKNDELALESRMNRGGVILINLDKGKLGTHESRFMGLLLTMQIFSAGLKRSAMRPAERRPVNIHIDEFQNFVTENSVSMLAEARKFGLRFNLANQNLGQLANARGGSDLLECVLGNVGNMMMFRLGVPDSERLRPFLKPFTPEAMQHLPNFHALVRLLDHEGPVGPIVLKTLNG